MNHLTNEQLEDIIQGQYINLEHLNQCPDCRSRLAERRAIAARLRSAFGSIQLDSSLEDRIRGQISQKSNIRETFRTVRRTWLTHLHYKFWPVLATAAAILVILLPLGFYLFDVPVAKAAQAGLVHIHQQNLSPHREFYCDADPEKLATYFKDKLGFTPLFPCTGQGMVILGCCVAHFKGQIVGSYVVDTPRGIISVIVVTDTPKQLGMTPMNKKAGYKQNLWESSYAQCNMVTIRLGNYSYCAIGEVKVISHEYLGDLLTRLLPNPQP